MSTKRFSSSQKAACSKLSRSKSAPSRVVQDRQDVQVELRRDARRVVVGGLERGAVLDQVGAQQEADRLARAGSPRGRGTSRAAAARSSRSCRRGRRSSAGPRAGSAPGHARSRRPGRAPDVVLVGDLGGGIAGDLLGDVHRRVRAEDAGVAHRVEQHARLRRRARSELDQRRRLAGRGDDPSAESSTRIARSARVG